MFARWESVETILSSPAPPSATPIFPVKALIIPGVVQIILTDNYNWIKRKVRKFQKKSPRGHIKRQTYHKSGSYVL